VLKQRAASGGISRPLRTVIMLPSDEDLRPSRDFCLKSKVDFFLTQKWLLELCFERIRCVIKVPGTKAGNT